MSERRFSGEQLLRWFDPASTDERDRLISGGDVPSDVEEAGAALPALSR
jgi:hypothetical protein